MDIITHHTLIFGYTMAQSVKPQSFRCGIRARQSGLTPVSKLINGTQMGRHSCCGRLVSSVGVDYVHKSGRALAQTLRNQIRIRCLNWSIPEARARWVKTSYPAWQSNMLPFHSSSSLAHQLSPQTMPHKVNVPGLKQGRLKISIRLF